MQYAAASGLHYPSTFHAIAIITRKEGLRGLYSGLMPTLARDAPYSGLYLFMYNRLQHSLGESMPTGSPQASISFLAGKYKVLLQEQQLLCSCREMLSGSACKIR